MQQVGRTRLNVRERRDLRNGIVRPLPPLRTDIILDPAASGWRDTSMRASLRCVSHAMGLLALVVASTRPLGADQPPPANGAPPPLHIKHGYGVKGLALWITAEDGITADAQGHVSQLVDRTGNFTLTPPNGSMGPAQIAKALNGHAVLRFTGSESLYSPDSFGNALDHDLTFIIVALGTAPADAEQFALYLGQNVDAHYNRSFSHYKGDVLLEGQFVGCYGEPVLRNIFLVEGAALNAARNRTTFYRDGKEIMTSGLALENHGARFEPVSDGVTLGAAPTNLFGWQGDIAEALVYDRELSPAEVKTIWTALSAKYGLHAAGAAPPKPPGRNQDGG